MNEDLLAAAVGDWLKATDAPAADGHASRSKAVAEAHVTRQARSWLRWSSRPHMQPGRVAAAAFTGIAFAAILGVLAGTLNQRPESAPGHVGGPSPSILEVSGIDGAHDEADTTNELTPGDGRISTKVEPADERDAERSASTSRHRGGDPVTVRFGRATLTGRVWPDGTVRVLDDGAGNATDLIDDVVVTPDDTVWVARNHAILAVGGEGRYRPPTDPDGQRARIIDLEARADGSLEVLTWRALWHFDDGSWTRLPTPPHIAHESDLDGYYPDPMPDGSIWAVGEQPLVARYTGDGWDEYPLTEIFPRTFPEQPSKRLRITVDGARDGAIWVAAEDGGLALAHFDGAAWTEFPRSYIRRVLGHQPKPVSDILTSADGITWILLGVDGAARDLVRIEGDEWSATPIARIRKKAGVSDDVRLQWLAQAAESGAVQMYTGEDEHRAALWWDGTDATLQEFGVFTPLGETSDGTLWGMGRNKDVGLLMRPAD